MPDCFCSSSGSRSQEVADVRLLKCAGFGGSELCTASRVLLIGRGGKHLLRLYPQGSAA